MPATRLDLETTTIDARELALTIADLIHRKQGTDIVILDVSGPFVIADYFVIASTRNPRHAAALANEIGSILKHAGRLRRNVAGAEGAAQWVLVDFDDVVVHLFDSQARQFYDLESLWADVPKVEFVPRTPVEADRGTEDSIEPL